MVRFSKNSRPVVQDERPTNDPRWRYWPRSERWRNDTKTGDNSVLYYIYVRVWNITGKCALFYLDRRDKVEEKKLSIRGGDWGWGLSRRGVIDTWGRPTEWPRKHNLKHNPPPPLPHVFLIYPPTNEPLVWEFCKVFNKKPEPQFFLFIDLLDFPFLPFVS